MSLAAALQIPRKKMALRKELGNTQVFAASPTWDAGNRVFNHQSSCSLIILYLWREKLWSPAFAKQMPLGSGAAEGAEGRQAKARLLPKPGACPSSTHKSKTPR